MVGSNTLKTKGLEKERQANLANLRGGELAEADRLEREAMMRRQRVLGTGTSFNSVVVSGLKMLIYQGAHPAAGAGQFNAPTHPGGYVQ